MNRKILSAFIIIITLLCGSYRLSFAGEWQDLHEEHENLFGSEKELKYNPDMFFLQRESWEDHYSFMFFWLIKYTDYPRYTSFKFIPLYYGLDSKVDSRSFKFIPLLLTYWETDGNEKFKINPLFISDSKKTDDGREESYSYSLLHGYSYANDKTMELPDRKWWFPIIPLVYRNTGSFSGHMNIAWVIDYTWMRDKTGNENLTNFLFIPFIFYRAGDNGFTNILPPLFMYNYRDNGEYWMSLMPFFIHSKNRVHSYNSHDKEKYNYTDSLMSLLFCFKNTYNGTWGGEEKSSAFWFPLIPLFYSYSEAGVESHRNIAGFIDWHNNAKGETDRFWLIPAIFHQSGGNGFTTVLPPLFLYNRHSSGEYWLSFIPFFARSKDKVYSYEKDVNYYYEDTFVSLFLYFDNVYRDTWGGEEKSSEFWFPLIPFFYSYNKAGVESHRNIAGLIDWHNNSEGETDRFWLIPFIFHESGDKGYTNIIPPLFLYNRHGGGEYWLSFIPFFARSKDKVYSYEKDINYYYEDTFVSLFLYFDNVYRDTWGGKEKSSEFWFPLVPVFYSYNKAGDGSHRNLIGLIDWHNNSEGETDRFWFIPFYFAERNSYRHVLPPLYISTYSFDNDHYSHLLPFYISSTYPASVYNNSGKPLHAVDHVFLTPLSGYYSEKSTDGNDDINTTSYWFPLLPLYYHSQGNKGTHTNLLWALDWERDDRGELKRFWFIPFIFHDTGEGGRILYIPFYFRPPGWTEAEGVAYSPFYYHRWSTDRDVKWSWLIHYKKEENVSGEYVNTWFPLYYYHNIPSEGDTTWVMPSYYCHDGLEHGGYFTRIVAPFYWNVETKNRDTTLLLPVYFETKKKNAEDSFYINILGWTRTIASGINPVADAGLGSNKKGLYLDVDGSWLYDMFSISTRVTIPVKKGEVPGGDVTPGDSSDNRVVLSKKNTVNRDTSINFFGMHALYGLIRYEVADTKKHVRVLPLWYITWDEKSADKITWILNYLSYKEDETEYFMVFPVYAYQRIENSYSEGYVLNAFWHEYDDEEKMNEYTVFWPIFNTYSSPLKDGWRLVPFVWHKNDFGDYIQHSSTITPVFIDFHDTMIIEDTVSYRLNFSPFHFYRYNEERDEKSELWFTTLPVLFYMQNKELITQADHEPAGIKNVNKKKNVAASKPAACSVTDTLNWLLPLYVTTETSTVNEGNGTAVTDYTLFSLPMIYYHSEIEKDMKDGNEKKKGKLFVMGYYNEFSPGSESSSMLYGLYRREKSFETGDYSFSLLYSLFSVSEEKGKYGNYLFPFYYYENDHGKWKSLGLLGLYCLNGNETTGDSGLSLFYTIFSTSFTNSAVQSGGGSVQVEERQTWFFPVFYYDDIESAVSGKIYSSNETLSVFHYRKKTRDTENNSYTLWFPIVPLFYHSDTQTSFHGEYLNEALTVSPVYCSSSYNIKNDSSVKYWFPILPLYYHSGKKTMVKDITVSETLAVSPFFCSSSVKGGSNDSDTFWFPLIPLFYHSTDGKSSHLNIAGLADYEKGVQGDYTRFWFMPLIFSKTGNNGYFHIAPFYFSFRDRIEKDYSYFFCGLYMHEKPGYVRNNFLFLYDYISKSDDKSDEYSVLFNSFQYRIDPEVKKFLAFWGLAADARWNPRGYDIEGLLYLAAIKSEGDSFHSRLLPFWYYKSGMNSHELLIPPLLTWDSENSDNSRLQLWALGALWFRDYHPEEKSDLQALLLGIPYYKYQTAERGYESRGSLWSLLWEYETEEDIDFSRFTLLKILYKRVKLEGEVRHTVLGITL